MRTAKDDIEHLLGGILGGVLIIVLLPILIPIGLAHRGVRLLRARLG